MSDEIEENPYILCFTDTESKKEVFKVMNDGSVYYKGGKTTAPQDVIDGLKLMVNHWRLNLLKEKTEREAFEAKEKDKCEKLN